MKDEEICFLCNEETVDYICWAQPDHIAKCLSPLCRDCANEALTKEGFASYWPTKEKPNER